MDPFVLPVAAVTGLLGAGVVWGVTQQKIREHDKRIDDNEDKLDELVPAVARIEGQVDLLVKNIKETK